jgi:hypothetical protein
MERGNRETLVGTRLWSRHTYTCINRDRSGDVDGRRQRLKCEININPSSSAIWHHINRWRGGGKRLEETNQTASKFSFFLLLHFSCVCVCVCTCMKWACRIAKNCSIDAIFMRGMRRKIRNSFHKKRIRNQSKSFLSFIIVESIGR